MSGIAGIFNFDGHPVDPAVLARMGEAQAHRGPDGSGQWALGAVGFVHRMLHATPESLGETQPFLDEGGELCMVLDGRIDNREELRKTLETESSRLRTDTDAELVLKSYQRWGNQCAARLLGDFAFAIWDQRRRRLFCARDPLGVRPLYYLHDDRSFVFASEMQPLFAVPGVTPEPNRALLAMFLSNYFYADDETLYLGVYRLRAGHHLLVENGEICKTRYFQIDPEREERYPREQDYEERFLDLFRQAVQARLRSHGPVGALLSGGLDSSSVVSVAALLHRQRAVARQVETFSVIFDGLSCDERAYIQEVIRKWELRAEMDTYGEAPAEAEMNQISAYPDVLYNPVHLMYVPALRKMQVRGIRVLLDGLGGDELLDAGVGHLADLFRQRKIRTLLRRLPTDAANYGLSTRFMFVHYCLGPALPGPVKAILRPIARKFRGEGAPSVVSSEYLRATGVGERIRQGAQVPKFPNRFQQDIYNAVFCGWNALISSEMHHSLCSRFGVDCRHPFLDQRIVRFLLAVPVQVGTRGNLSKAILRQAMAGILPEAVRTREGKAEFSPAIDWALKVRQPQAVRQLVKTSALVALGVADCGKMRNLFDRYFDGAERHLAVTVQVVLGLELWCRDIVGAPGKP